jgi:hypothetical protein
VKEGFDFIERLLREGDEDVRGITTVGILEVLQIRATHHSYGSAAFVPFLGPESQLAWRWIEKVWEGN